VTYFADNDAGLEVACLGCKTRVRVPVPVAAPKAEMPAVHPDEPPPLFFATPRHLMVAPPSTKPSAAEDPRHHPSKSRPVRPASPRSRWRVYGILLGVGLLGVGAALINKHLQDHPTGPGAQEMPAASQPATRAQKPSSMAVVAVAKPSPVIKTIEAPRPPSETPPLASIAPEPVVAAALPARVYTPAGAPVGFIGFERVEMGGRTLIDSYNAAAGPYAKESAQGNAAILSNGAIRLNVEGQIRAAVHSGLPAPIKTGKKLTITGPTDPLVALLAAPLVELDPFSHDSANARLPRDYFKNGNFNVDGNHSATLAAGIYYVNDLVISSHAALTLQGPVTFLVSGQVTLIGKVETHEKRPVNFQIRLTSDKQVVITHTNSFYVDVYAPQSPIRIDGKGDVFGSIVGKTLLVNGTRNLHFDESLALNRNQNP
jgi:hypothetical protein